MRDSKKEFMEELAFEMILKKRQIEVGGRENSEQRKLRKQR